ncbi:NlpC/P60 family protein [Ruegeria hyattellae]|uniref:NlpC/P60 family protein n=1 Tax=Ruegeria hyattellae TaxID=3233337 RepID=UPI00355C5AF9
MNARGPEIVEVARSWLGTPYRHQSAARGAGCDCLGLIRGVWRECYGAEPETAPAYSMDWSEPKGEERMWAAARRHLIPCEAGTWRPGDVLLFRMRSGSVAKHVGILSEVGPVPRFIHSYSGHGVVESALSAPWRRKVVARFEFPVEVK